MPARRRRISATQRKRIPAKIRHMRREGVSQKRAVGAAHGMARQGRITKGGGYRRVKRRKR